jgi:Leucine-rich repeat (LRR) protein
LVVLEKKISTKKKKMTFFPYLDIPSETRVLDLRHNSIHRLSRTDLHGLVHLETLFLGNNQLSHLGEVSNSTLRHPAPLF